MNQVTMRLRLQSFLYLLLSVLISSRALAEDSSSSKEDDDILFNMNSSTIKAGQSVAAVVAIVIGAIMCIAGYKLFRGAIFVCSFLVGGVLFAGCASEIFRNETYVSTASWVAFFIGGAVFFLGAVLVSNFGIFLVGASFGVFLAFILNTLFGHLMYPSNPDIILLIFGIVLGIVGGLLAFYLERPFLIVATSFVGADMLVWGVGYFIGDYPSGANLEYYRHKNDQGDWVYDIPAEWWGYFVCMLVIFVFGMVIQFKRTAYGIYYSKNVPIVQQQQPEGFYGEPLTPQDCGVTTLQVQPPQFAASPIPAGQPYDVPPQGGYEDIPKPAKGGTNAMSYV